MRIKDIKDSKEQILRNVWKEETVYKGIESKDKPRPQLFNNMTKGIEMVERNVGAGCRIAIHYDVDFDGSACAIVMEKSLKLLGVNNVIFITNSNKQHGVKEKQVEFLRNNNIVDFLIILDSSTNEIENIKRLNCDVLVLDHHESSTEESYGYCDNGVNRYVVINSTLENKSYEEDRKWLRERGIEDLENVDKFNGTQDMSAGLLTYEFMRTYFIIKGKEEVIEKSLLWQWAAMSLYTDSINTMNKHNQWYIQNTIGNSNVHPVINTTAKIENKYFVRIDKSFILYKYAPTFNKAIRANAGDKVIDIICNSPNEFDKLFIYKEMQEKSIDTVYNKEENYIEYAVKNISNYGISANYSGVVASRICGDKKVNAAVYSKDSSGVFKGSFRGRVNGFDYRAIFQSQGLKAEGHPTAFGFEVDTEEKLTEVMKKLSELEPKKCYTERYITLGNMEESRQGRYHASCIDELTADGLMWQIACGNSHVIEDNEIMVIVDTSYLTLVEKGDKYCRYKIGENLTCVSFEEIKGEEARLYLEFSGEIKAYLRNYR